MHFDPERERQRLRRLYSEMSDAELLRVADDPGALTEAALEALEEETERRGLELDLEQRTAPVPELCRWW